ncbi:dTDP-4-dehydrorhamnose reductase [Parapedobacter sp. 2B3]|uniref:dTDP-4-dehydrorhamnose reductase n=1 Tax=Parapedobacter sp. 2B3 TaxID=3342381 RepID=UPI0035B63B8A
MKVLVTGVNGQVGSELRDLSTSYQNFDFVFSSRVDFPLQDLDSISVFLDCTKPDIIVNTAAYTAVDLAEDEPDIAEAINHLAVKEIADWCQKNDAKLIHISTDYVFDGHADRPLTEDTEKAPINEYGKSKHLGEEAILKSTAAAIIIRTAWVYSPYGRNFVKTMLRLMEERDEIAVVNDQIGSPTYARDLAFAILEIISSNKWKKGIYHYANEGGISWCDFAYAIRDIKQIDCKIVGIPTASYPTPAKRPMYSLLDKRKVKQTFGLQVPEWRTSLAICLNNL